MKTKLFLGVLFALNLWAVTAYGQINRKVAVLEMTVYNPQNNNPSRKESPIRLLKTVGVPFDTTSDLYTATQYPIIITGTRIQENSFNAAERTELTNYVANGGVLITSSLRDSNLFDLCGVTSSNSSNTLYQISFDTEAAPIFDFVNAPMETTVSIGDSSKGFSFYTRSYGLGAGEALAHYGNGTAALVKNTYGQGAVYLFGPDFRDIIFRNQMNLDISAQRVYSNGFEPSTDVFMFIVRNIVRNHIPHTVSKYTIPYKYPSALMITHDVDVQTTIDTMHFFSDYEQSQGISALYTITTSYLDNGWIGDFYNGSWDEINNVIQDGHVLGSHSVGHFPDFGDEDHFPLGALGNTEANYTPHYSNGTTTGGTVIGEVEVSKHLLGQDHGVTIKSFRVGHLAYNDSLALGLQIMDYSFDSSFPANDVLSSFPYYLTKIRSFHSTESTVLELPMTLSDVMDDINGENYQEMVAIWTNATNKYAANHSPVVLLIHPDRQWKLDAEIDYIDQLPSGMAIYPFEDYGRFWRKRDSLQFHTAIANDTMTVGFDNNKLTPQQSFVIDFDGLDTVEFVDQDKNPVDFEWIDWDHGTRLYYQSSGSMGVGSFDKMPPQKGLVVYPNPTDCDIHIVFPGHQRQVLLTIYDMTGRKVYSTKASGTTKTINIDSLGLEDGIYMLNATFNHRTEWAKFIYRN